MTREGFAGAWQGAGLVALSGVLWGTVGVASKLLFDVADVAPLTVGFYRLAIAVPLLFVLIQVLPGVAWRPVATGDAWLLVALGVTQAGYQGLYFFAVAELGVTRATLIALCSAPVLITVLAAWWLRERAGVVAWLAVPIAVAGTGLLVGGPTEGAGGLGSAAGYAAAAGAALCYAVFALASRQLASRYHPFQIIVLGFGLGALLLLPMAVANGLALAMGPLGWSIVAFMGVVPTALAYAVFFFGMRRTTATASGVLVLMEPLTAAVLAFLILGEALGPLGLVGAVLLCAAVMMVSRPRQRRDTG